MKVNKFKTVAITVVVTLTTLFGVVSVTGFNADPGKVHVNIEAPSFGR